MAETPTAPQAVRERGYATSGSSDWWGPEQRERTPELRWPQCIDIYDAMRSQDPQVSSVLRAITTPITRTGWRVDGSGCDDNVTSHVAADLGLPIVGKGNAVPVIRTRDRFSWRAHLPEALLALTFGHAVFEQVYRLPDTAGLYHLRKLGYRPPETIANFKVARDGGLIGVEQYSAGVTTGQSLTLPVNRLVVYVNDREGGVWTGRSLLRPAYKAWLLKDRALRTQSETLLRNGMGVPVYTGADQEKDLSKGRAIAESLRAGSHAGAAIPHGAELELMGVTGTLPNAAEALRYHDEQIARAVLAHFLNLGSQTGSWALGSTFADFFTLSLQATAEQFADTANKHIVEDLVDLNYGPDEPAPRLVFDEIGSRQDAIVQAIALLVREGVLRADESLEQFLRTALGLPGYEGATDLPTAATDPQEGVA